MSISGSSPEDEASLAVGVEDGGLMLLLLLLLLLPFVTVEVLLESTVMGSHTEMPNPRQELSLLTSKPRSRSGLTLMSPLLLSASSVGKL